MVTAAAARSISDIPDRVAGLADLAARGWTRDAIHNQVQARRWQRVGRAIVLHNGPVSVGDERRAALVNAGPRAAMTSFTALSESGMAGWERPAVHLLVPRGARVTRPPGLRLRLHYTDDWDGADINPARRLHRAAAAAVLATLDTPNVRVGCGLLAAVVQQRLARPEDVLDAVAAQCRLRNRRLLLAAAHDITQGAQALSEIDFGRLCRRAGLPAPLRQAVRRDPSGRRRYLDAEWCRADGRRVVAEVDGAIHLAPRRWWDDQLRQNELVLDGSLVLRFPSVVIRSEPGRVVEQLRRALGTAARPGDLPALRAS